LLPAWQVLDWGAEAAGQGPRSLRLRAASQVPIEVTGGAMLPPGQQLQAYTPARHGPMLAALLLAAVAASPTPAASPRRAWAAVLLALAFALLLLVALPAVLLAGLLWSALFDPFEALAGPALLVALARTLLHGGDLFLVAAAWGTVWALRGTPPRAAG
jgi:hypothetical protein